MLCSRLVTPDAFADLARRLMIVLGALVSFCASACSLDEVRRLDPRTSREPLRAERRFSVVEGEDPEMVERFIAPGDILVFSGDTSASDASVMFAAAVGKYRHIAIAYPYVDDVRLLSADSEDGVYTSGVASVAGRSLDVYAFPEGSLDLERIAIFARKAAGIGALDYDWSAVVFGLNSNLTPNSIPEIGGEYTCATAVAAALHFSGLSLDDAYFAWQYVSPADIVHSVARRNMNGPRPGER